MAYDTGLVAERLCKWSEHLFLLRYIIHIVIYVCFIFKAT